jgi:DNA polymerase-1
MNKINSIIKEQNLDAKMLLQIHDELIFEVDEEKALKYGELFKTTMEEIMHLNIPLKASLNIGDNWQELK